MNNPVDPQRIVSITSPRVSTMAAISALLHTVSRARVVAIIDALLVQILLNPVDTEETRQ